MHVDDLDRKLLRLLQQDASAPVSQLAEQIGMSTGPCWRRIEKLEKAEVITGWGVQIDPAALGFGVQVFLRITLDKTIPGALDAFIREARDLAEVCTIQTLLGRVDVRMDIMARDLEHYQEIYKTRILALPHIADIEALMLVSEIKNDEALPL